MKEEPKKEGSRLDKAISEEVSRVLQPHRELRSDLEKILWPDVSEVKKKREKDRGR